jgi:hypothetical protein
LNHNMAHLLVTRRVAPIAFTISFKLNQSAFGVNVQ